MKGVLEIAAYCSLVVAMTLLVLKLFWPKVGPKVHVRLFRHRLGKVDTVLATWTAEQKAQDDSRRREERHPETTDD